MFASFNARSIGRTLPAEQTIAVAAAAGFEGVDLLVRDALLAGSEPAALRLRMDRAGLRGGAWPLPVAWRGAADPFHDDLRRLPRYAAAASTLGLRSTGTWVMPEMPPVGPAGSRAPRDAIVALHRDRLGAIARILGDHGVRLGLEVIGVESFRSGGGLPLATRLDQLDALIGPMRGERPNVGLLVDAFHLHAAAEPIDSALQWGVERIVWVHLADLPADAPADRRAIRDEVRALPGESGMVPCAALLARLASAGYHGPVTAEPLAACRALAGLDALAAARAVRAALRAVWPPSLGS